MEVKRDEEDEPRVTLSVDGWALADFCRELATEYGVSSVVADTVESRTITAEFTDIPVSVAMDNAAKRLGVDVRFVGGVYYIGSLDKTDRGILVRRVRRLSGAELQNSIESQLTENGSVVAFDNGLCVVADVVTVLDRVEIMLDEIESLRTSAWVVQLHVIAFEESAVEDLGIDVVPAGQFTAVASTNAIDSNLSASIEATLRAVVNRGDVRAIAEPMLLLSDGERSTYDRGQTVPYATELVDATGGTLRTRSSIEFLDVGFSMSVELRELTQSSAAVTIAVRNSRVVDTQPDLPPTVSQDNLESVVPVENGGVYLAGSFVSEQDERRKSFGFRRGWVRSSRLETYQVWLRAYRIDGDAIRPEEQATKAGAEQSVVYGPEEKPEGFELEEVPEADTNDFVPSGSP